MILRVVHVFAKGLLKLLNITLSGKISSGKSDEIFGRWRNFSPAKFFPGEYFSPAKFFPGVYFSPAKFFPGDIFSHEYFLLHILYLFVPFCTFCTIFTLFLLSFLYLFVPFLNKHISKYYAAPFTPTPYPGAEENFQGGGAKVISSRGHP